MEDGTERWLPVVGYEGYYEVSDLGRVRSLDRWIEARNRWGTTTRYFKPGRVLRPGVDKDPAHAYEHVILCANGTQTLRHVHHLVLETFVGPRPAGLVACHGPAGNRDNSLQNLRWDSMSENQHDRVRDGNHHYANRDSCDLGHRLLAPNLQPDVPSESRRRCYACALTGKWARHVGYKLSDLEWRHEANRRYAEILHFSGPLNYRLPAVRKRYGPARWQPNLSDSG
jgi:hypothetical protein